MTQINGHGKSSSGGYNIFTGGYLHNTTGIDDFTPSSYKGYSFGLSASPEAFVHPTGSYQTTYSQPLLMLDYDKGCYWGEK